MLQQPNYTPSTCVRARADIIVTADFSRATANRGPIYWPSREASNTSLRVFYYYTDDDDGVDSRANCCSTLRCRSFTAYPHALMYDGIIIIELAHELLINKSIYESLDLTRGKKRCFLLFCGLGVV